MKIKRNIKAVNFVCDNPRCLSEKGFMHELDSDDYESLGSKHPFPYEKGWIYIYNLVLKISGKEIVLKDKHFCSEKCLGVFLQKAIRGNLGGEKEMKTVCPYCKYQATHHETLNKENTCKDGEISFCISCGEISEFKSNTIYGLVEIDIDSLDKETKKEVRDMKIAWLKIERRKNVFWREF